MSMILLHMLPALLDLLMLETKKSRYIYLSSQLPKKTKSVRFIFILPLSSIVNGTLLYQVTEVQL
jgi:hypothetical protein